MYNTGPYFPRQSAGVETYKGIKIYHSPINDEGYFGANGCDDFGYTDTVEEIRAEIDDYWTGSEHGPLNGYFNGGNS